MNDSSEFDMGAAQAAPEDTLARLRKEIDEGIKLEEWIDQSEEEVKAAKRELQAIKTQRIPDLMAEIQSDKFNFSGFEVRVDDFVSGTLPKEPDKRDRAIQLLEGYEAGSLIKTAVKVEFGRTQHNEALALADELKKDGHAAEVDSGVHPQTLLKFARDRIADGKPIDLEALGLYTGKVAKWKELKK